MTASEKVAYLKGLAEGLDIDKKSKEGKLFAAIIDTLEELADDIADLENNSWELGEAIDQVSDDLSDLEDYVYDGEDEDEDEDEEGDEVIILRIEEQDGEEVYATLEDDDLINAVFSRYLEIVEEEDEDEN